MGTSPEDQLRSEFRKYGPYVVRGVVTAPEYTNKVFDTLSYLDRVYPAVIPELWEAVPAEARAAFEAAVRAAARPGFRYQAFYIGPGPAMAEDERRRDADLRTARVRAWAEAFVRWWG
jgi:hypothetical protein